MSDRTDRQPAFNYAEAVERRTHTPPDDGGRKPVTPPPKPSDARTAASPSRPKRTAAALRREHLPALAAIHERILGNPDLCHALEIVMVMAGYLTEEASNPMGAHWHGDSPDA